MKTIKYYTKNSIVKTITACIGALICFALTCLSSVSAASTFAATLTGGLDYTTIESDLADMDLSEYTYDENGTATLIAFYEFCYSANSSNDYELYFYVYNPRAIYFNTRTGANVINMATSYSEGEPAGYDNLSLTYIDSTDDLLLYKFRLTDSSAMYDVAYDFSVKNSGTRRYDIAGIQLWESGESQPSDYTVANTYYWTGYAKGYSDESEDSSTLSCSAELLDVLQLDVQQTSYDYNNGSHSYSQLKSVYFAIPNEYFDKYGSVYSIHAEYYRYDMSPIIVVDDYAEWEMMEGYRGVDFSISGNSSDWAFIGTTNKKGNRYNLSMSIDTTGNSIVKEPGQTQVSISYLYNDNYRSFNKFAFLYYASGSSTPSNYEITRDMIEDYMNEYTDEHGTGIAYSGFNDDLFLSTSAGYEGKTTINITGNDTITLSGYNGNAFSAWLHGCDKQDISVDPIHIVTESDLENNDADLCNNLYVDYLDIYDFKDYCETQMENDYTVVMFRFQADTKEWYYAASGRSETDFWGHYISGDSQDRVYFITCELGFDIIDIGFQTEESNVTIIPVVANPINVIPNLHPDGEDSFPWLILILITLACCIALWLVSFVRKRGAGKLT